jgi:hypothetical protein
MGRIASFIVLVTFLSALTAFSGFRGCRRKYDIRQIDFRMRPFRADCECRCQPIKSVGTNFAHYGGLRGDPPHESTDRPGLVGATLWA